MWCCLQVKREIWFRLPQKKRPNERTPWSIKCVPFRRGYSGNFINSINCFVCNHMPGEAGASAFISCGPWIAIWISLEFEFRKMNLSYEPFTYGHLTYKVYIIFYIINLQCEPLNMNLVYGPHEALTWSIWTSIELTYELTYMNRNELPYESQESRESLRIVRGESGRRFALAVSIASKWIQSDRRIPRDRLLSDRSRLLEDCPKESLCSRAFVFVIQCLYSNDCLRFVLRLH